MSGRSARSIRNFSLELWQDLVLHGWGCNSPVFFVATFGFGGFLGFLDVASFCNVLLLFWIVSRLMQDELLLPLVLTRGRFYPACFSIWYRFLFPLFHSCCICVACVAFVA